MARQRIGVTSSGGMGVTQPIATVGRCYLDGVVAAGGLPLVLPALATDAAPEVVAGLDGLVLTGGGDIDPARYGQPADPACGLPEPERDAWELALVGAARHAGIPVLGICRGIQVLAVAFGGTLIQDLPTHGVAGHDQEDRASEVVHEAAVVEGSRLHRIVGAGPVAINTLHHQAVDPRGLGAGMVVTATTADGVVEGVEVPGEPVVGVQWHPELLLGRPEHQALFDWVVAPD
jgi:putative glutamine amidotransferase